MNNIEKKKKKEKCVRSLKGGEEHSLRISSYLARLMFFEKIDFFSFFLNMDFFNVRENLFHEM